MYPIDYSSDLAELAAFLKAGVSPYHTIQYSAGVLAEHGFTELPLSSRWQLEPGKGYRYRIYGRDVKDAMHFPFLRTMIRTVWNSRLT